MMSALSRSRIGEMNGEMISKRMLIKANGRLMGC